MPVGGGPPIDQATGIPVDLAVDEAAAVEAADLLAPYVPQRFLTANGKPSTISTAIRPAAKA